MKNMFVYGLIMAVIFGLMSACCGNCSAADNPPAQNAVVKAVTPVVNAALEKANDIAKSNAMEAATAFTKELTDGKSPAIETVKAKTVAIKTKAAEIMAEASTNSAKGWGHEIGTMLREAGVAFVDTADGTLTVTEDHLFRFAQSDVGKFTMFAIGWKLFANDAMQISHRIMGYLIGIGLLVGLSKTLWAMNRRMCVGTMQVVSKKGWWIFSTKTYEFKPATVEDDDNKGYIHLGTGIAQVILIIICCMIMF